MLSVIAFSLDPSWVTDYLRSEYIGGVWILLLHDSSTTLQRVTKREKAKGGQLTFCTRYCSSPCDLFGSTEIILF